VFFQLSEKQPVVLSNHPIVILLEVLKKVENCFGLVDLTVKPKQSVVLWFQPIVSLKILTKFNFEW